MTFERSGELGSPVVHVLEHLRAASDILCGSLDTYADHGCEIQPPPKDETNATCRYMMPNCGHYYETRDHSPRLCITEGEEPRLRTGLMVRDSVVIRFSAPWL